MIAQSDLEMWYTEEGASMQEIATRLGYSPHKVAYWMNVYGIKRRSISEAIYQRHNPSGDPFQIKPITTANDAKLLGLGIGLYWGEGTKANKHAVRLGNSDPELIKMFMKFLIELFGVDKDRLKFGLQVFTDIDQNEALNFWVQKLDVKHSQFYKIHATISGSLGTYRRKSQYGVVTVYFQNKKLRDILVDMLPT